MISDTLIFSFGVLMFAIWIIGTLLEFRNMSDKPEEYKVDKRKFFQ
ncbi:MAG: hypothetical protein ACI9P8_001051 [Bacteroidia bacterium]|jgi:hypothetical protein